MDIHIKSYEEFCDEHKKYDGGKCYVAGCNQPAYYEGGDARCWCPMCEDHADMPSFYYSYLGRVRKQIETRMKWDKKDPTLKGLLELVTNAQKVMCVTGAIFLAKGFNF